MKSQYGFTLIELLIALAIFAILATITSTALFNTFHTRERLNQQADKLNQIALALNLLKQDTLNATERATRGNEMRLFPPFIARTDYVEFTRDGMHNPNQNKQSTLKRIAYLCNNHQLIRRIWLSLDTPDRNLYSDKILLKNLTDCHFNFINQALQSLDDWQAYAIQVDQKKELLPRAVQLSIAFKQWGKMNMLFKLPGGNHDPY